MVTTESVSELKWLADKCCLFALPFGRTKNKFEKDWPNKPHSFDQALQHAKQHGNVGILTGKHSRNIIAIDRDINFLETATMIGRFAETAKIIRDNAPGRGKFLYRITDKIPPTTSWKPVGAKHPECEFLGDTGQRHALCPTSEIDGGNYRLIDTEYGIQELSSAELDYLWRLITGGSIFKEIRDQEEAEADKQAKNEYVRKVKEAWTIKAIFEHFDKVKNGTDKDHGQTRILGNGGLLISTDETQWFCHADSVGGDLIDAFCWCKWSKKLDRSNPKMFWDAVNGLADLANIARPILYANGTNGHHASDNGYAKHETSPKENASHNQNKVLVEPNADYLLNEGAHDEGNAQCVNKRYRGEFLHSASLGWLAYTGTHWAMDEAEARVERAITETLIARAETSLRSAKPDSELIKRSVPNASKVNGAKAQLHSLVSASPHAFDTDPDSLNCKNGVVDLRTGEITPHSATQRFMHCTTVGYDPSADTEPWENWLTGAVGTEMADWLQVAVGYSLTGHTREEILFYLYGPPRSGKGTFTETLLFLLGIPLAKEVNFSTFTAPRTGDSQNFDLAPLKPCRFVAASESNAYEKFNEAKVKALTGGNEVYCAFKHRDHFNYRPQFKIWLSSNQPVNADPDDDATWGRLRVIEFPCSHLGREDKALKQSMRKPELLQGVLAWAVLGAIRWYQLGNAGLPELQTSITAKSSQREALDNVQGWISECCLSGGDGFTANSLLYLSYERWCKENGIEPKKQKGFSQSLIKKGYKVASTTRDGKIMRGFRGIGLN